MPFLLHSARTWSRLSASAAVAASALVLAGCQSVANAGSAAQLRVIDASPDAPALDIVPTSSSAPAPPALYNVGFGTVSSYMRLTPGTWAHAAYLTGSSQQLANLHGALAPGAQYTLLVNDISADLHLSLLRDQSTPAPSGLVSLRFLGESTRTGPIDLYLVPAGAALTDGFAPAAARLAFGSNTGYRNLPAGDYSLVALPAGLAPGSAAPLFTSSQMAYPAGSARTVVLVDGPAFRQSAELMYSAPSALHILTATDYDPPGS
ncbi:MAG TPA: DUF4397 domain-containing protein [Acidobacteriaceae bacterium]|nr:DUF4397 domain-containing protein [Acidobacteriaceae bacterium]